MSKLKHIDPIEVFMSQVASKIVVVVEAGYENSTTLYIKIDPKEILKHIPSFIDKVMVAKAQYEGHTQVYSGRPDKVVIAFDGHQYEAKADYEEVVTNTFKGYK